jgi:wyosine [tRNA(Phe)-imidazoG37] synthetase (radical SAM superfamily)
MQTGVQLGSAHRAHAPVSVRGVGPCHGGREFFGNRYVYSLISPRAGGLTVGVNLTPDRRCNFDCVYCDVHRQRPALNQPFEVEAMAAELENVLDLICHRRLRKLETFRHLPDGLLELKHVALSGEGEPTLCEEFADAVRAVVHIRARGHFPFFKIVLLSNGSVLDQAGVQAGLRHLILQDEIWLKLDAGGQEAFDIINRSPVPFERVFSNILNLGRQRPIIIQSLFPLIDGVEPSARQIQAFIRRLEQLVREGAKISLVQVYSANRLTARSDCRHLPLKSLSRIAHLVRESTGLPVEVF